jgi:hypothetical protein
MSSYVDLWRLLVSGSVGRFAGVWLTCQAVVWRLQRSGLQPLSALNTRLNDLLQERFPLPSACPLAPFAHSILAFDETTLDVVHKHLPALRPLPTGDPGLVAGKVAALFDIRRQHWVGIQFRADVLAHCSVDALSALTHLAEGTLLLFDLGYFAFAFFDALTDRKLWWVTRLRSNVTYQLAHTHYRHEGTLDALVWLGGKRSCQAGHLVRLVRVWDGRHPHSYLTNVTDPLAAVARRRRGALVCPSLGHRTGFFDPQAAPGLVPPVERQARTHPATPVGRLATGLPVSASATASGGRTGHRSLRPLLALVAQVLAQHAGTRL